MTTLIELVIYIAGFTVGTALGARVFFGVERRANPDGRVISAYQMAALQGAVCGLLWPITLPLLIIFGVGWQAVRIAAPREVRAEVSAYNTAMMERMLGQKDVGFEQRYAIEDAGELSGRCAMCRWRKSGTLEVVPGCPVHDPAHFILDLSSDPSLRRR